MSRTVATLLAAVLLACGDDAPEPERGFPVTLYPVESVDLRERIKATGELRAVEHAEIAAEVGGRVTEILVDEGSRVEAGTEVMTIDPERRSLERDSARARVGEAAAQLRDAKRDFERVRDLFQKNVASQEQLDGADTGYKLARSRLLAAEAQLGVQARALRDARVTAPFAGYVGRRGVSRGEYVQPGQALFELVALDPIEVEFRVPEVDSARVALSQVVDIELSPFPDEIFVGTVTFVSPTIDPSSRTLRVKALLENPNGRFRPGLFAKVDLGVAHRTGVSMVPEEAVLQRADGPVVFRLLADDRVERRVIETGVHRGGMLEVTSGLEPGDRIISRGQAWLTDGQRVTPRNSDGTLARRSLPPLAEEGDRERAANLP